ncbi:hypothetical protein ASPCAL07113 [Aspergillus calidoustus]|uniref:Uncharacterized protein n=1 Tax=Aspergillus calidoustus TaxID=454130 RepID=A0A0U5G295_ASPCI|nr:hypothetical protein ASPCAL07113 [Aspergillus calidoustus]
MVTPRLVPQRIPISGWRSLLLHRRSYSMGTMAQPDLFSYTSGRYIYNEDARLRERYVEFDPGALLREVEKHIGLGHGRASRITKLAEGDYNRVFQVTMDDGFDWTQILRDC